VKRLDSTDALARYALVLAIGMRSTACIAAIGGSSPRFARRRAVTRYPSR
jgi:hypothetical protein